MDKLNGFAQQAQQGLDRLGQAGMSVSVVQNDEIIFSGGFGFRDVEQSIKADEKTVFPIGSATKSFTATAVMLLQERGLLDIDKPIRIYLPELVFQDEMATRLATARDLLCHRTGLPRHDMLWVLRPYVSRQELPALIRQLQPSKPFRAEHQYNNLMYACLGRLVEKVDGRCWEQFVQQELLDPLNMRSACFTPDAAIAQGNFSLAYERSRKRNELDPVPYSRLGGMAPAGAIHTNVLDLANWVRFQLSKGCFGGDQILSAARIEQMHTHNMPTPDSPFAVPESCPLGYALGWEVESFRGKTLISHGGNVAGSSAMVAFMPEIRAGVSIAVNTGTSVLTYATMYDVFDRLLGLGGQKNWAEEMKGMLDHLYDEVEKSYGMRTETDLPTKSKRTPDELVGLYQNPAYGYVKVALDEEGMPVLRCTEHTMLMKNQHYDVFSARLILDYQTVPLLLSFQTGIDGSISKLLISLEASVEPIEFIKSQKHY